MTRLTLTSTLVVLPLLVLLACSEDTAKPRAEAPLRADGLTSNCLSWPEVEFSRENRIVIDTHMNPGMQAVDFELRDIDGNPYRLSSLLETKPVLLVLGSYTCPRYQDNIPVLNRLSQKKFDGERSYGDEVHFVHVYIVEAHPKGPDPSPYNGVVSELRYSEFRQAKTYESRLQHAATTAAMFEGPQVMLVDGLDRQGVVNPVWCTYGSAPNATYLIGQDGIIREALNYSFAGPVESALFELLIAE